MPPSVVIVSNRLPISVKKSGDKLEFYPSVGGLATGLASYVKDKRNKWIGWPGIPSDDLSDAERRQITIELKKHNCYPVFLTQSQLDDYYSGYSNTILWPLFHDLDARDDIRDNHDRYWQAYKTVNNAFAGVVLALSDIKSTVWVHDYQLFLLPRLLRTVRPKAKIGFFLHIPFPDMEHLSRIPSAPDLMMGMLGADLFGLHTKSYAGNFMIAAAELTQETVVPGQVIQAAHVTRVTDFPISIDYNRFIKAQERADVKKALRAHRRKYKGLKVILTVDRLDPTKGIPQRLEAYQEFLRRTPAVRGKVIMVMLCTPSRTEIEEYDLLRKRVDTLIAHITKEFATTDWQPLDVMFTAIPVESVTALYQVADVAFITPLRDGMNLVAKEYVASRPKRDGVLILSSTAGAAQELTDALLVNPRKSEAMVQALTKAIRMPRQEIKRRISNMQQQVATHTVQHWAGNFMRNLQVPAALRPKQPLALVTTKSLTASRRDELLAAYRAAKHPVLLFDYDGVLSKFYPRPEQAVPTKAVMRYLERLSSATKHHTGASLAIISGRSSNDLELWFGDLPINLAAEHGALLRRAGQHAWKQTSQALPDWQDSVQPILEKYAANTPGAFVEAKQHSLVWHYREASAYYAQKNLVALKRILQPMAKAAGLGVYRGNKILEIKPKDINKGVAARQFITPDTDFILCLGDDYTDEDMFQQLPANAYTIKVGPGKSVARLRLRDVESVHTLLKALAN